MASPFVGVTGDLGARIVQGSLRQGLSGPIPWHCLRIFFMRDRGSHQRVFASLLVASYGDEARVMPSVGSGQSLE